MKIEKVNVLVGVKQRPEDERFPLEVYQCGQSALPVTEIPILQAVNGLGSVSMLSVAGDFETSKQDEWDRLVAKYPEYYQLAYPSAAVPFPKTLAELDVEPGQIDRHPTREIPAEEMAQSGPAARGMTAATDDDLPTDRAELRRLLGELGVNLGFGNHGVGRLQAELAAARAAKAQEAAA